MHVCMYNIYIYIYMHIHIYVHKCYVFMFNLTNYEHTGACDETKTLRPLSLEPCIV